MYSCGHKSPQTAWLVARDEELAECRTGGIDAQLFEAEQIFELVFASGEAGDLCDPRDAAWPAFQATHV